MTNPQGLHIDDRYSALALKSNIGQSAIMNSVEGGKTYLGSPAGEWRQKMREIALIAKLPDLFKKMEG